tara:strand:- start:3130 stop:3825 length:696 start_codon:yes stop_codon:yes gene_type:complete
MDDWDDHEVTFDKSSESYNTSEDEVFEHSEGLEQNETTVRVLDTEDSADEKKNAQSSRMMAMGAPPDVVRGFQQGLALESEIRQDPGYKFLMLVSAFSNRKLGKLVSSTGSGDTGNIDNIVAVVVQKDTKHWMQEPEISGVIYLAPFVYGHIKEAQQILRTRTPLKMLVENAKYKTLFARLVAIRMCLSNVLSEKPGFNDSYVRLHQQQTMVLKALKCITIENIDWTRPNR